MRQAHPRPQTEPPVTGIVTFHSSWLPGYCISCVIEYKTKWWYYRRWLPFYHNSVPSVITGGDRMEVERVHWDYGKFEARLTILQKLGSNDLP